MATWRSHPPEESVFDAHRLDEKETARQKRFKAELREKDRRRFGDPDRDLTPKQLETLQIMRLVHSLWTWRAGGWHLLGFRRVKITPRRIRKWRRQTGVVKGEVLRLVPLTSPPPSPKPPLAPPSTGNRLALRRANRALAKAAAGRIGAVAPTVAQRHSYRTYLERVSATLPKVPALCSECRQGATFVCAYTRRGRRRVEGRCPRHSGLYPDQFPEDARHIVCIQRVLPVGIVKKARKRRRSA